MNRDTFDQFSSVRIAYEARLDGFRQRFNAIVDDAVYLDDVMTDQNMTPFNEADRAKLQELLDDIDKDSA